MTNVHSIVSKSASVLSYISENVYTTQAIDHKELLKAVSNMYRLNPQSVFLTCPASHKDFFYLSENCVSLFGYSAAHMQRILRSSQSYFGQIHDADVDDLRDCMGFIQQFFTTEVTGDLQNFRGLFYYRFRHANGSYIYVQDQKATFAAADQIVFYSLLREMDPGARFQGVKLEIYREQPHFEKLLTYKPSEEQNKLTSRETDLVNLMKRGLTTKEIAQQLHLSHNTVRNIKSKMFSKYSVTNSIELLNVAG